MNYKKPITFTHLDVRGIKQRYTYTNLHYFTYDFKEIWKHIRRISFHTFTVSPSLLSIIVSDRNVMSIRQPIFYLISIERFNILLVTKTKH